MARAWQRYCFNMLSSLRARFVYVFVRCRDPDGGGRGRAGYIDQRSPLNAGEQDQRPVAQSSREAHGEGASRAV